MRFFLDAVCDSEWNFQQNDTYVHFYITLVKLYYQNYSEMFCHY